MATRFCQSCGREMPAAVELCPHCGAAFEVTREGYCTACHTVAPVQAGDVCATCGGPLVDVRTVVRPAAPAGAGSDPAVPLPASAAPAGWPATPAAGSASAPGGSSTAAAGFASAAAASAPPASTLIYLWQPLLVRMSVGNVLNALACVSFVVATWLLDWATESGYFLSTFYRGPLLLPIVVMAVVLLLLWRTPGNQRPRKGRTTPMPEWRRRWRENRRRYGARGAFRPVTWGTARTLAAAVVWLLAAGVVAGNLAQIEDVTAADVGAGGWVALAAALCGFVGCLLCLPVSRRRLVQVDADGGYYGVSGAAGKSVVAATVAPGPGGAPMPPAAYAASSAGVAYRPYDAAAPAFGVVAPPKRRSRALWVVLPVVLVLIGVVALGSLVVLPRLTQSGFTDAETTYVSPYLSLTYGGNYYTMEGLALALQAEKARLNGMEPTPGSVRRAHTFFRRADDFYEGLLAETSPSPRFDPVHKPWRRAVRLERAALIAYAEAYDRPTTLGGWEKGSRLVKKAEQSSDASWDRFVDLQKESATADQVEDTARLMERLDQEWRGE